MLLPRAELPLVLEKLLWAQKMALWTLRTDSLSISSSDVGNTAKDTHSHLTQMLDFLWDPSMHPAEPGGTPLLAVPESAAWP